MAQMDAATVANSARRIISGKVAAILALVGLIAGYSSWSEAGDAITVGDLLAACHKSADLCGQAWSDESVNMAYLWANCIPSNLTMIQKDKAVLRWLVVHPDLSREDAGDGVADAAVALWPCGSGQ
jgi:hypothetical protein